MAVKYTVSEKGNPLQPQQQKKWYANAKSTGDTTLRALSKEIAQRSTVSPTDMQSVLIVLTEHLSESKIARLGDFGAFQVSIGSEGAETAKFNVSMIKTKKVTFRPGIDIKKMLNNLKFEKQ
ncbi:MAG: DNA-binding protein [Prevotellaceae bacterium]|jgi:predicted histone-like DNA-binding protein|nr:DNA-binding protein [Prevotellaceae bacterium]